MAEHLTEKEIELYRAGEGDHGNRRMIATHLAVCQPCLDRFVDYQHSVLAINALTEAFLPSPGEQSFHLSHAELEGYAAGSVARADQIICESHIEICEQCDHELRVLSTAKKSALPWSARRFLSPARIAAGVALLGLLTLVAFVWWQRSSRPTRQESAGNGTPATPGAALLPSGVAEATPQPDNESGASVTPVVASLKDNNREIRLDQQGKLTGLEGFDGSSQTMVKSALAGEGLVKPDVLDGLSSPPIKLLGEAHDEPFRIIDPAGEVITEQRPTLRWRPGSGATSYVVSIFDNNFNRVDQSPPLSRTNWTVDVPLQRGQSYFWEVVAATKDGKEITAPVAPTPRAQFKLLEADKLSILSKLKQQKPVSHLALGLMYARFGMVSDAEAEFRKLVKENPDSALAKKLLRTVQAWRAR